MGEFSMYQRFASVPEVPELYRPRPAQLKALLGGGIAGLLALFVLISIIAAPAVSALPGPALVFDNLALYASRGHPIHYCQYSWQEGDRETAATNCAVSTDLAPFQNRTDPLSSDEIIWVEFTSETLDMTELVQMWGRPQIEYDRAHRTSLRWTVPTAGLSGWMFWGDPREIPATTSLVLEALDESAILSPE